MKKVISYILTFGIAFFIGLWFKETNISRKDVIIETHIPELILSDSFKVIDSNEMNQEKFRHFFYKFIFNDDFQLDRIKFPLQYIHYEDWVCGDGIDTTFIVKNNWKHNLFYLTETSIPIIYDNFEMKLDNSDERVFCWRGVENGLDLRYYFNRIKGKWYLLRKVDFSN